MAESGPGVALLPVPFGEFVNLLPPNLGASLPAAILACNPTLFMVTALDGLSFGVDVGVVLRAPLALIAVSAAAASEPIAPSAMHVNVQSAHARDRWMARSRRLCAPIRTAAAPCIFNHTRAPSS